MPSLMVVCLIVLEELKRKHVRSERILLYTCNKGVGKSIIKKIIHLKIPKTHVENSTLIMVILCDTFMKKCEKLIQYHGLLTWDQYFLEAPVNVEPRWATILDPHGCQPKKHGFHISILAVWAQSFVACFFISL